ncbi:MAG: TetR/AcrR family transcriptional regulator [Clostridia bacterium]|nr:TetR/AcrR family transcriptional regulator [Clostridia bacterium]
MPQKTKTNGVNMPKTNLGLSKMNTIVNIAEELFANVGFYQTSIADICKKAHTAVGTFYIYFESKMAIYRYLVEKHKTDIKHELAKSIKNCTTRAQKEREGIKCFIRYALIKPTVYNVIWGSLSVDKQLFKDYYQSFADSYAKALNQDDQTHPYDTNTVAYMLMGIANFLGLHALFNQMTECDLDYLMDNTVMPMLTQGLFVLDK